LEDHSRGAARQDAKEAHQALRATRPAFGTCRGRPDLHLNGTMAARTAEQKRRRAENERRRYVKRRMAFLRELFPGLPPDASERGALRQVSAAVRRAGVGQGTLSAFSDAECSSGPPSK